MTLLHLRFFVGCAFLLQNTIKLVQICAPVDYLKIKCLTVLNTITYNKNSLINSILSRNSYKCHLEMNSHFIS